MMYGDFSSVPVHQMLSNDNTVISILRTESNSVIF